MVSEPTKDPPIPRLINYISIGRMNRPPHKAIYLEFYYGINQYGRYHHLAAKGPGTAMPFTRDPQYNKGVDSCNTTIIQRNKSWESPYNDAVTAGHISSSSRGFIVRLNSTQIGVIYLLYPFE